MRKILCVMATGMLCFCANMLRADPITDNKALDILTDQDDKAALEMLNTSKVEVIKFRVQGFLELAIKKHNLELAKAAVLHGADLSLPGAEGKTALLQLCEGDKDDADMATFFIYSKTDVNVRDRDDRTPLMYAAFNDHKNIATALLSGGADVNLYDNIGHTALSSALEGKLVKHMAGKLGKNDPAVFLVLLDLGKADPNVFKPGSNPVLFNAIARADPGSVEVLIEHKADVNIKGKGGNTPLIALATAEKDYIHNDSNKKADLEILELLLKNGADPKIKNDAGLTALDVAKKDGKKYLAEKLGKV